MMTTRSSLTGVVEAAQPMKRTAEETIRTLQQGDQMEVSDEMGGSSASKAQKLSATGDVHSAAAGSGGTSSAGGAC